MDTCSSPKVLTLVGIYLAMGHVWGIVIGMPEYELPFGICR